MTRPPRGYCVCAGVYDALVWGMVITILNEVPELFSAGAQAGVRLDSAGVGHARRHKLLPCC